MSIVYGITLFVFLTTGCAKTYRAAIYPIPPVFKVKEFQGQGEAVSIRSEPMEGEIFIGTIGGSRSYYADIKQVSDVIASFLAEELSKRGFLVQRDAPKSITLNVYKINLGIYLELYRCNIKMFYRTSDGFGREFLAYNAGWNPDRACNGAITRGVADLLNDEKLIDFLKSSER